MASDTCSNPRYINCYSSVENYFVIEHYCSYLTTFHFSLLSMFSVLLLRKISPSSSSSPSSWSHSSFYSSSWLSWCTWSGRREETVCLGSRFLLQGRNICFCKDETYAFCTVKVFLFQGGTISLKLNHIDPIMKVFSCCFGLTCTDTAEGKVCLSKRSIDI